MLEVECSTGTSDRSTRNMQTSTSLPVAADQTCKSLSRGAHKMRGLPRLVALLHSSRQGANGHLLFIALQDLRHRNCSEGW